MCFLKEIARKIRMEAYINDSGYIMSKMQIHNTIQCNKCGCEIAGFSDGGYDFLQRGGSKDAQMWNTYFEKDCKIGIIKRMLDRIISYLLPPLFNGYARDYILKNYTDTAKMIEMGCGESALSKMLLNKQRKYGIILMDFSDIALRNTIKHFKSRGEIRSVTLIKDDFYNCEQRFPSHYFDLAFNCGVIEHFDDPIRAVKNMSSIAKRVVCIVPARGVYFGVGTLFRRIVEHDATLWTEHTKYYTIEDLKSIFIEASLKNIKVKTIRFMGLSLCHFATGEPS